MFDITNFNIDDYSSFTNVDVVPLCKYYVNSFERFPKIRVVTYQYPDDEYRYITEEQYISSDDKLFFHVYDAILYEYNIDLTDEPFKYI